LMIQYLYDMQSRLKRTVTIGRTYLMGMICFAVLLFAISVATAQGAALSEQLKVLTSVITNRNYDSLRRLVDPGRIYVEIGSKDGAYLTPSQTIGVLESYFRSHTTFSFSFSLIREEGTAGIANGTLLIIENGMKYSHRISFGFQKNISGEWLLSRINVY
jgi:hypothetical protein